jgi:Melibiase/Alpha galactosidase C-terminal beta sandwich domain
VTRTLIAALFLLTGLAIAHHADAQLLQYRPGQEYRSLNTDAYQIAIQKNGRLDVALGSTTPVFLNAFPMYWEEGDDAPRPFKTDGRFSRRYKVDDLLGKGQGMLIQYKNLEWTLRAYPAKPYFAVQAAYVNTGKKPVTIKALYPWCIGDPKDGAIILGTGTAQSKLLSDFVGAHPVLTSGPEKPSSSLALVNMSTNRSVVAGFLTGARASTSVTLNRTPAQTEDLYDWFRAQCVFDPPVTLNPGERLDSEVFYIALAESNPVRGVERFAKAVQVVNQLPSQGVSPTQGWYMSSTSGPVNERSVLNMLGFMDANLKPYGWTHLTIGSGWDDSSGSWMPDPAAFPRGIRPIADYAHQRGLTLGLEIAPFTVPVSAPWLRDHPDWVSAPASSIPGAPSADMSILDASQPLVQSYLAALGDRVGTKWGVDAVHGVNTAALSQADSVQQESTTRVEAMRLGLASFREGLGPDVQIWQNADDSAPFAAVSGKSYLAHAPTEWRYRPLQQQESVVAQATQAARQSLSNPHLGVSQYAFVNNDHFSIGQQRAWLTALALSGSSIQIDASLDKVSPSSLDMLTRILPLPERPAKPMDLFFTSRPRIWYVPIHTPFGEWNIVALFNWSTARPQDITIPFAPLSLQPGAFYSVYDFWADTYYGSAKEGVKITVPPASVRLIGLRPLQNRPMVLALNRHILMGTAEFRDIQWNPRETTLKGTFQAIAHTDYGLNILVPENFTAETAGTSNGPPQWRMLEKNVLKLDVRSDTDGPVDWEVRFSRR